MRFDYLYIKDFGPIKEIEFNFDNRINLIVGENGQGKSTVADAIKYILTGNLNDNIIDYVRKGCDKFVLRSKIYHEGNEYEYNIEGSKSASKELIINKDVKNAFYNSEASKEFAKVVDPVLASYSAISEQGKTTELLFMKPSERLKTIKKILKVDDVADIISNIQIDIDEIKDKVKTKKIELVSLENVKFSYMDLPKKVNIDSLKQEYENLLIEKKSFEESDKLYKEYLVKKSTYNTDILKRNSIQKEITDINIDLNNLVLLEESIIFDQSYLDEVGTAIENLKRNQIIFNNKKNSYLKYKESLEKYNKQVEDLKNQLSLIIVKRVKSTTNIESSISEITSQISDLKSNMKAKENQIQLALNGKCPTCNQDYKYDVNILKAEYKELEDNYKKLSEELSSNKNILDSMKKEIEENNEALNKRKNITDKITYIQSLIDSLERVEFDENVVDNFEQEIEDLLTIQSEEKDKKRKLLYIQEKNADTKAEMNKLALKAELLQKELNTYSSIVEPVVVDKPEDFNTDYFEEIHNQLIVADQVNKEYDNVLKFNEELKEEENKVKKDIDDHQKDIHNLEKDLSLLKDGKALLDKEFTPYLIDKGTLSIKEEMNEFFQRSYGNEYNISFQQDKNSISFFYNDGVYGDTPVSRLSGYQKSVYAMAARVALSNEANISILVLDEIDDAASNNNSIALIKTLLNEHQFEQFFIISHNEDTKETLTNLSDCEVFEIYKGELA